MNEREAREMKAFRRSFPCHGSWLHALAGRQRFSRDRTFDLSFIIIGTFFAHICHVRPRLHWCDDAYSDDGSR